MKSNLCRATSKFNRVTNEKTRLQERLFDTEKDCADILEAQKKSAVVMTKAEASRRFYEAAHAAVATTATSATAATAVVSTIPINQAVADRIFAGVEAKVHEEITSGNPVFNVEFSSHIPYKEYKGQLILDLLKKLLRDMAKKCGIHRMEFSTTGVAISGMKVFHVDAKHCADEFRTCDDEPFSSRYN
jgi:hypothetical protein